MRLTVGLDTVVRRKIPSPYRDSNPPIIQPVAQRYTAELPRILTEKTTVREKAVMHLAHSG
jgi:hypothetical protein